MSRHALPVLLFLGHAAMVTALTAVLVVRTGASRGHHASGHSRTDELSRAEAALSGSTRLDVQASREALSRGDLFQAGQYLAAAMAERRARR